MFMHLQTAVAGTILIMVATMALCSAAVVHNATPAYSSGRMALAGRCGQHVRAAAS